MCESLIAIYDNMTNYLLLQTKHLTFNVIYIGYDVTTKNGQLSYNFMNEEINFLSLFNLNSSGTFQFIKTSNDKYYYIYTFNVILELNDFTDNVMYITNNLKWIYPSPLNKVSFCIAHTLNDDYIIYADIIHINYDVCVNNDVSQKYNALNSCAFQLTSIQTDEKQQKMITYIEEQIAAQSEKQLLEQTEVQLALQPTVQFVTTQKSHEKNDERCIIGIIIVILIIILISIVTYNIFTQ